MNSSEEVEINDMFRIIAEAAEVTGDNSFIDILKDEATGKNSNLMSGGAACSKKLKGVIKMIVYVVVATTLYTYGAFNPDNISKALTYIIDNSSKLNLIDCKAPSVSMLSSGDLNMCYIIKKFFSVSKQAIVNHLNELHKDIISEPDLRTGTSALGTAWIGKTALGYMSTSVKLMISGLDTPIDAIVDKICDIITLSQRNIKNNNNNGKSKPSNNEKVANKVEETVMTARRGKKKSDTPKPTASNGTNTANTTSGGGNSDSEDYTLSELLAIVAEAAAATGDDSFEKLLMNPPSGISNSNTPMTGGTLSDMCIKDSDTRKVFKYIIHAVVIYMFRARIYDFTTNGFLGAFNAVSNLQCSREPGGACDMYATLLERLYNNVWKIVLGGSSVPVIASSEFTKKYLPGLDKALKELFDGIKKISSESTSGIRDGFFLSVKVFMELDKELVDNVIDALCKAMSRRTAPAVTQGGRRRTHKQKRRLLSRRH